MPPLRLGSPVKLTSPGGAPTYSFCVVFDEARRYEELVGNLEQNGFTQKDTEYLFLESSGDQRGDMFKACRAFLVEAAAPYVVLCHPGVRMPGNGRAALDLAIEELDRQDIRWALFGPSVGGRLRWPPKTTVAGPAVRKGHHRRTAVLDDRFIVVRRSANLGLSNDVGLPCLYGLDLCTIADVTGLTAYQVDLPLTFTKPDLPQSEREACWRKLRYKYRQAFRSRWLPAVTTNAMRLGAPARFEQLAEWLDRVRA